MSTRKQEQEVHGTVSSPLGPVLTTAEVAEILKTSQRTVQRLIRLHQLKAHRVGRGYRVLGRDLQAWFEQAQTEGPC